MIELYQTGAWLLRGSEIIRDDEEGRAKLKALGGSLGKTLSPEEGRKGTIAWGILSAHNSGD
ncbi:MAG: hypothetical protein LBP60_05370, partial [Spirochaetaceae bacterium]|nr:hypothetical protein [Spirochaetaceae bacterium]